jgi:hypothetical protein
VTLEEVRASVGRRVVCTPYAPELDAAEEGVITSAGTVFAFVLYDGRGTSKATDPARLTLAGEVQ